MQTCPSKKIKFSEKFNACIHTHNKSRKALEITLERAKGLFYRTRTLLSLELLRLAFLEEKAICGK